LPLTTLMAHTKQSWEVSRKALELSDHLRKMVLGSSRSVATKFRPASCAALRWAASRFSNSLLRAGSGDVARANPFVMVTPDGDDLSEMMSQ
jgi:hypothetical protein